LFFIVSICVLRIAVFLVFHVLHHAFVILFA
jgi:hypothetical protein